MESVIVLHNVFFFFSFSDRLNHFFLINLCVFVYAKKGSDRKWS